MNLDPHILAEQIVDLVAQLADRDALFDKLEKVNHRLRWGLHAETLRREAVERILERIQQQDVDETGRIE